jgi:nickel-type superoxide dismutase maturation protease
MDSAFRASSRTDWGVDQQSYHQANMPNHRASIAVAGVLAAVALWRPFRVAAEGTSMVPVVMPGDYLVGVRTRRLRPGDLVVVEHPRRPGFEMVKRLAGMPGDDVGGRRLAPGEHWVLGTGDASTDSRTFGPVSIRSIRGVVKVRYWPPERARVFR